MKFTTFIVFLFLSEIISAQSYQEVLTAISKKYAKETPLSVQMEYQYFNSPTDKTIETSLKGAWVQTKSGTYFKIGKVEVVSQNGKSVTVDHDQMTIAISSLMANPMNEVFNPAGLDSLIKKGKVKVVSLPAQGDVKGLAIEQTGSNIVRTEIWYDVNTYDIKNASIVYQEWDGYGKRELKQRKIMIIYSNYKRTGVVLPKSLNDYILIKGKTFEIKPDWRNYKRIQS